VYAFFPNPTAIVLVQSLHGICYGFFFATVYIFVDEYFPKDVRASAQGLFNAVILGAGALAANSICPYLLQKVFAQGETTNYRGLFLVPLIIATLSAIVLTLFFHPPIEKQAAPTLQAVAAESA
jgi:MFS family permease